MNFSKEDFPELGASGEQKSPPKNDSSKDDSEKSVLQPADRIFQCLMCNKKGPAGSVIRFKDRLHMRFMFEKGLCVDCSTSTPKKEILCRYVGCDWIDSKEEKEKKEKKGKREEKGRRKDRKEKEQIEQKRKRR